MVRHEGLGQYFVTRWSDCVAVLGNAEEYVEDRELAARFFGGDSMKGLDGERHSMLRGIWAEDFRKATIERRRAMVAEIVDGQLLPFADRLRGGGPLDAVAGMVRAIPTIVIAHLLGLPREDHQRFIDWSERMIGVAAGAVNDSPAAAELVASGVRATGEMNAYLGGRLARAATTQPDLIGTFRRSPLASETSTRDAVASLTQLGFAGNETTPKLMASVLYALDLHPEQRELLIADRSLVPQAVEEVSRWCSAAQVNWRIATSGGEIDGVRVPAGAMLLCLEGIANRDPRRWENPDEFNILRPRQANLGFGFGRHLCLGLHLARLEVQVWLDRLLDVLPRWRVVSADWGTSWVARGPVRLEIAV